MPTTTRHRFRSELEAKHTQRLLTIGGAALLAFLAPLRVIVTVHALSPAEYGFLAIINTMTSFVPYLMTVGYSLQYQLMTVERGPAALEVLSRQAVSNILRSAIPCGALTILFVAPFASAQKTLTIASLAVITSACVAYMMLASQSLLGLGNRSSSALCLLVYNSLCSLLLLPLAALHLVSILSIVLLWTLAAMLGALVSRRLLHRFQSLPQLSCLPLSLTQAGWALPVLLGPWTFLMLGRYFLGFSTSTADVTQFSLAWTIVDLSYLVAVSGVTYLSTRLLRRDISASRVFGVSALGYTVILCCVAVAATIVIPRINHLYHINSILVVILALTGLARLAQATWAPLIVRNRAIHRLSLVYLCLAAVFVCALATLPVTSLTLSFILTLALGVAALASASRTAMNRSDPQ